jgi:hypothetical protein
MCNFKVQDQSENPICIICFDDLVKIENVYSLGCGHIYCDKCLDRLPIRNFDKYKCPLCRTITNSFKINLNNGNCPKCLKNYIELKNKNNSTFYLIDCAHIYCCKCLNKNKNKCNTCKTLETLNIRTPIYFS